MMKCNVSILDKKQKLGGGTFKMTEVQIIILMIVVDF